MDNTHRKPFLFLVAMLTLIALVTIGFSFLRSSGPNWSPDAAQRKLLAPPVSIGSYTICPPKGYLKGIVTHVETAGYRLRIDSWYARQPGGTRAYVRIKQRSRTRRGESLNEHLRDQLQEVKYQLTGVSITRIEHGEINGIPGVRAYYKGSLKKADGAIEGRRGFLYVLMPSHTKCIIISSSAADSVAPQSLRAAEASALTLRRS